MQVVVLLSSCTSDKSENGDFEILSDNIIFILLNVSFFFLSFHSEHQTYEAIHMILELEH